MTVEGKYFYCLFGKVSGQKKNPCFSLISFRHLRKDFTTVYFPEEYATICPRKAMFGGLQAKHCITKKIRLYRGKIRESEKAEDFASGSARNSASLSFSVKPFGLCYGVCLSGGAKRRHLS